MIVCWLATRIIDNLVQLMRLWVVAMQAKDGEHVAEGTLIPLGASGLVVQQHTLAEENPFVRVDLDSVGQIIEIAGLTREPRDSFTS